MKKLLGVFLAMSLVVLMASPSRAGLAINFSSTPYIGGTDNTSWVMGFEFVPKVPIYVTSLGLYDYGANGLTQAHNVGIYDSIGNLLGSDSVSNADPLTDSFHFHAITPLRLEKDGVYYIMGVTGTEIYTYRTGGFVVDPSINFINDTAYSVPNLGVLHFPDYSAGYYDLWGGGWFGPNFESTTLPVPVPPTLLLLSSGLLGLVGWRRLRKA
jgi:hypothetical protein